MKIKILTNYSGLGVYIPALKIRDELLASQDAEIIFLENCYVREKLDNIEKSVKKFQKSFKAALMAQKIVKDIERVFDPVKVDALLDIWEKEAVENFIVLSGFWLPILEKYKKRVSSIQVDLIHTNADISISWKQYYKKEAGYRDIWLFNGQTGKMDFQLEYGDRVPAGFCAREKRFIIHGGGWGIGTYRDFIPLLIEKGFKLDIFLTDETEDFMISPGNRYFKIAPAWKPFSLTYPPHIEITRDGERDLKTEGYHFMTDLASLAMGIISKPGGATLSDSLYSAVPAIFLDPYGPSERKNQEFWEKKGFGLQFEKWAMEGFCQKLLEECHKKLLAARQETKKYPGGAYAAENRYTAG